MGNKMDGLKIAMQDAASSAVCKIIFNEWLSTTDPKGK